MYSVAGRSRTFFSCSPPSFVRVWNDNVSPHHRPVYLLVLLVAECVKLSKQRYTVFWLVWLGLIKSWMPILYTDFLRLTNCLSLTVNLIQQAMRDDLCSPIFMELNCWTIIAALIAGSMCWCALKVLKERKYMVMIRLVLAWCIFYFIFIVYKSQKFLLFALKYRKWFCCTGRKLLLCSSTMKQIRHAQPPDPCKMQAQDLVRRTSWIHLGQETQRMWIHHLILVCYQRIHLF